MAPLRIAALTLPTILVFAVGCAQSGSFPSLAPRAAEMAELGEPARTEAPQPADDTGLAAQLDALLGRAREGQRAFTAALRQAGALVSRGGSAGSESWVQAQQAISRLEEARAPTVEALADLDGLARARDERGTPTSTNDRAAISAAIEEARSLAAGQQQEMERLNGSLSAG